MNETRAKMSMTEGGAERAGARRLPRCWWLLAGVLVAGWLGGCATEADGVMPWSTPLPGEGSVPLPSGFRRD